MKNKRIRTVIVNDRGQIVIPEDIRKDLGIGNASTLVMIEHKNEIILRREQDILSAIDNEETFWKSHIISSMKKAWYKEDEIWDKLARDQK
ncbi:MAG: AbrB/MazE/SpoVT family DNA-binding domain-containing protein [Candidatus Aenigmatarchaeota archaeon]